MFGSWLRCRICPGDPQVARKGDDKGRVEEGARVALTTNHTVLARDTWILDGARRGRRSGKTKVATLALLHQGAQTLRKFRRLVGRLGGKKKLAESGPLPSIAGRPLGIGDKLKGRKEQLIVEKSSPQYSQTPCSP